MDSFMTLRTAGRSLGRHRLRTGLTMLGIVIGIWSVVALVSIGQSATGMIETQISSMGHNLVIVFPGAASSGGLSVGMGSTVTLTPEDAAAIAREIPTVSVASPVIRTRAQIVFENQNWVPVSIFGSGAGFNDVRDWPLAEGEFFDEGAVLSSARVCVLGTTVAQNLFQGSSPLGHSVRIKNMSFRVVGVLSSKGTSAMGQDQDDLVVLPWTTVKNVLQGSAFRNIDFLLVTASSTPAIPDTMMEITFLLRQRHHLRDDENSDFQIIAMTEVAASAGRISRVMTALLSSIASISLLVGGIGIMNIMLVSVFERTREIGVRRTVGARGRDILAQFLAEAVVLTTTSGLIGIFLGVASTLVVSRMLRWEPLVSPAALAASFLISLAIGVFFGLYPAIRAARVEPIEALRYE
ncbi:MAG TPA: ABC transporter permease [Planctomycetota bacterium]|nr:ABC transporter permease [Planctomycetota bacterium]